MAGSVLRLLMPALLLFGISMDMQMSNWMRLWHTGCDTQRLHHMSQLIEKSLNISRIECVALCAQEQDCRYVLHQKREPRTCLTFLSYNVDDEVFDVRPSNDCIVFTGKHFQGSEQRFSTQDVVSPSGEVSITSLKHRSIPATEDDKDVSAERATVPVGGDGDPRETSHCTCIHPQYKKDTSHPLPNIFTLATEGGKTYLQAFDFGKETFVTLNIEIEEITDIAVDVDAGVVFIAENKSPASMISISKFCCDGSGKITLANFKGSWLIASDPILDSVFYVKEPNRRGKPRIIMLNVNTRTELIVTNLQKKAKLIGADFVNQRIYWIGPHYDNLRKIMSKSYNSRNDKVRYVVSLPQHARERYWLFSATYPTITWCATDDSARQYFMGRKESRTVTKESDICMRVGRMKNGFFIIWRAAFEDISSLVLYDQQGTAYKTIRLLSHDMFVI